MAYIHAMRGPVAVVELPTFQKLASRLWDHDERDRMIDFIARNPEAGDLIPGTGGLRKLRWQRSGMGKRGGARVVYFYHDPAMPVFLLLAYAKARQEDMTTDEKRQAAAIVAALKRQLRTRSEEQMTKFGADLIASLTEALDFAKHKQPAPGEPAARVHLVKMPDTRAIRRGLRMSQHEFAEAFRIPVATVKNWEQGRRVPDAPAAAYLQVIARRPDMILEALREAAG